MFFGTGGPGILARLFEEAGLEEVKEHRQFETMIFRDEDDVADAVLMGGPVALAVKRFDESVLGDVKRDFLASVAAFRRDDGSFAIPGEFVTVAGRRPPG